MAKDQGLLIGSRLSEFEVEGNFVTISELEKGFFSFITVTPSGKVVQSAQGSEPFMRVVLKESIGQEWENIEWGIMDYYRNKTSIQ